MGLGLFILLEVSLQFVLDLFSHQFSLHGHGQPLLLQVSLQCHFIYFGTLMDEYHLNEQNTALLQKHSFVTRPSAI